MTSLYVPTIFSFLLTMSDTGSPQLHTIIIHKELWKCTQYKNSFLLCLILFTHVYFIRTDFFKIIHILQCVN